MAGPIRTPEYDSATIRRIAVEALADPRTVVKRLSGERVAGVAATRIDAALAKLKLTNPSRQAA